MAYEYTKLSSLKPGNDYSLYAVIESLTSGIAPGSSSKGVVLQYCLSLIDSSVASEGPIKCRLNFPENLFKGQLFNSAIIRLHRCPCVGLNDSMELSGVVGNAGLHVVAFTPFFSDLVRDVCLVSSKNMTYDESDRIMVEELRAFYQNLRPDVSRSIRQIFLQGDRVGPVNFTSSTSAVSSISRRNTDANSANASHTQHNEAPDQNKENDSQIFDTSFDLADFNTQARVDKDLPDDSNFTRANRAFPSQCSSIHQDLEYEEALKQVYETVERVKQQNKITCATRLCNVVAATETGRFFDMVCQVVGVLYSTNAPDGLYSRVYLRVVDGTIPTFPKTLMNLIDAYWDEPKCRVNTKLHEVLRRATVDIVCYDEFQGRAAACNPGDIIHVKNFRAHELNSIISLKVNGNGSLFKRGIHLLQKADDATIFTPRPTNNAHPNSTPTQPVIIDDDEDIKFPIEESVMGSPTNKRARIDDDSFVAESPRH